MIDDVAIEALFTIARSHNGWLDQPVTDAELRHVYDLARMGPTALNAQPMRVVFVRSPEAKARLKPALAGSNIDKVMAAPACAIIAYDLEFQRNLPRTFPHRPEVKDGFEGDANLAKRQVFCMRNGTLQGAYLIMAARAIGLDAGPMSGFDNAKVDAEFFAGTSWRSNFLCALGHGDSSKVFDRLPRLPFEETCRIL